MNAISERLKVYFDQCKLNSSDVASKLGYKSSEKIGRLFRENDKNASPSAEILKDIANIFEDLSIHWVLTGDGEMLKSKTPPKSADKEGVNRNEGQKEFSSHIENPAFQLILQELHVVRKLLAWTLAESCKIPEKKILEKTRSIRSEFQGE